MKNLKRTSAALICSAFFLQPAAGKELSAEAREALLANLEKLNDGFESKSNAKIGPTLAALRGAMSSDEAANNFYLKCVEKVHFTDLKKKSTEFREWRTKGCPDLSSPGFSLALRHQLRWLILTVTASSPSTDRVKLAGEAQEAMDALAGDFSKLGDHQRIVDSSVMDSDFARAFELHRLEVPNWPLAPSDLLGIYENVILEPYRKTAAISKLQAGWTKCIQQMIAKNAGNGGKDKKKGGPSPETKMAEHQKFLDQEVPEFRWRMEVDLYRAGDQEGATGRMIGHLEKHYDHSSWRAWASEFKLLMKPELPTSKQLPKSPSLEDYE
jgi:hypothetical protein